MGGSVNQVIPEHYLAEPSDHVDPVPLTDPTKPSPNQLLREWIPRRPAVLLAAGVMGGIALHRVLPIAPMIWAGVAAGLLIATILLRRRDWLSAIVLLLAAVFSGTSLAQLQAFYYPANHVCHFATETPRLARIELLIDHPPRVLSNAFGQFKSLPPKQVTLARVTRIKTWAGWEEAQGKILVQIAQPHPRLATGQVIRVLGLLQRPAPAANPGQFDWAKYYRDQRILVSLQVLQAANIELLSEAAPGLLTRVRERTRELLAAGFSADRSLDHALLRALLLGDSDPELRDVQDQFKRTGTSHHLAISGLHVAVLTAVVLIFLRLLRFSPRVVTVIVTLFVIGYGAIALPSPPVMRSVLLFGALAGGVLLRRRTDPVQLLCVAVLVILIYHPLDLYNAGFQLSFGTVLGLMLFTDAVIRNWHRVRGDQIDPDFRKPTPLVRLHRWFDQLVVTAFAGGLVAWLVSMPLIALHFEQLNPWAIPAGIVLAPVVFVALIGGFAKVLLTLAWPSGAAVWATFAVQPVALMRQLVDWLARVPGADVPLPAPPLWLVLAFYAFVLFLLIPMRRPKWQMLLRYAPAGVCLAMIFLPLLTGRATTLAAVAPLKVTLLAVGAGQTAVIQTPGGRTVLVDAGSLALQDLVRRCLGPFLRQAGERQVDAIFLTHGDYDHISGVADVVNAYDVSEVYLGPRFATHAAGNAPAEGLLRALKLADCPTQEITAGDTRSLGSDVNIEVLWPVAGNAMSSNNDALVLRLTYAGRSILFTGDIQDDAMRPLLADPHRLKADVLIAPHHGSAETFTQAFINAVDPKYVLSSNDRTLTGKQKRLGELVDDRPLLRTNECGAITITIEATGDLKVETFLKPNR